MSIFSKGIETEATMLYLNFHLHIAPCLPEGVHKIS